MTDRKRDLEDLERRAGDISEIFSGTSWGALARQIPLSRIFVRPDSEGAYMAIELRARWIDENGGPILLEVAAYLGDDESPVILKAREVPVTSIFQDIRADVLSFVRGWSKPS